MLEGCGACFRPAADTRPSAEETQGDRPAQGLVAVLGAELGVDVGQVGLDRRQGDVERRGDLAVRLAFGEQGQDG